MSRWTIVVREPLVVFAVLGAALYAVLLAVRPAAPAATIDVPVEMIRALVEYSEQLYGRPLADEEIRLVVADHVDEEVLLREARARRFDENDPRVRKRLLTVMRSALDEPVAEPSVAQLEAYYRERSDQLRSAPSVTLEHVHFVWGSERLPDDPVAFRARLVTAADPAALGDPFVGGNRLAKVDRQDLVLRLGPAFADAVAELPLDVWSGPVESRAGVHYVRVLEHHPSTLLPFADIEPYLRDEWMFEQRRGAQRKKIDELRAKYDIVLPPGYEAAVR